MELKDLGIQFSQAVAEIRATRPRETFNLINEAFEKIRLRIQNKYLDENGQKFGTYSNAVVPRWYFNKLLGSGAQKRLAKKGWFVSYSDAREAKGLETEAYNYTFTGRFFRELNAAIVANTVDTTTAEITASDYSQLILDAQSDRIGKSILLLSVKELQLINDAYFERAVNIIRKYI